MGRKIEGTVISVTESGDLITDIQSHLWETAPRDSSVRITVDDEHETFGIFSSEHDQPVMTLIAIGEPDEPLRLTLVGDSASMMLGVRAGSPIRLSW